MILKNKEMRIKDYIVEIIIPIGICILLIYSSEAVYYTDTARFLKGSLLDPPLYSFLIYILNLIFGNYKSIIIFQTILIGISIIYFTGVVSKIFDLEYKIKIIISLFLFVPIIKFYNILWTEPLCYAFSILFVSFAIKLIHNFKKKNLIGLTSFTIALLVTRNQFMFLYPLIIFLSLGVFIINNRKKNILKLFILSFVLIFLIHNSAIILNTYIKKNKSENINKFSDFKESLTYYSTGPSYFIFLDSIYVSSIEDVKLFKNQNIQKLLINLFEEMQKKKSLIEFYDGRGHFAKSTYDIREYSQELLWEFTENENVSITDLRREIYITLLSKNFFTYVKHLFKKFYDSTWLFIFVPFVIFVACLINFLKYKSRITFMITFLSLFVLTNHLVVYLFGRVQPRYFIYTDILFLISIFLFYLICLQKIKKFY